MPKSLLARYAGASNGRSLQTDEKALLAVCEREAWVRGSTMGRRVRRAITAVKEKTRVTRKTNPSRPEPPEGRPMTGVVGRVVRGRTGSFGRPRTARCSFIGPT